jgi:hypothetical protein
VQANFSKLIHTPQGFTLSEIEQTKWDAGHCRSAEAAWQKAVELGLRRIATFPKLSFIPHRWQEILRLVEKHVVEPSLICNTIALGQWEVALNRES